MSENINEIYAIFPRGAHWFNCTVLKTNSDLKNDECNMSISWNQILDNNNNPLVTDCVLQILKDSNQKIIKDKYKIINIENKI
jgi:hypothetical protein